MDFISLHHRLGRLTPTPPVVDVRLFCAEFVKKVQSKDGNEK